MGTHDDFFGRASDHGSSRHSNLWDYGPDVSTKHLVEVVDYGLSRSNTPAWSMENEVKTFGSIEAMDSHHEAVLIFIVDFQTDYTGFRQETGVISNDVSIGIPKQFFQIPSANNIYGRSSHLWVGTMLIREVLDFFENLIPVRHYAGLLSLEGSTNIGSAPASDACRPHTFR
jgi:hypothetical protein